MARYSLFVLKVPLNPKQANKPGQVIHTYVLLSSDGIIWNWPKGSDALLFFFVTAALVEGNG